MKRSPISIFLGISSYIQKLYFWELDPYLRVPFFCGQRNFPLCLWHRHGMVPNLLFVLPSCLPHLPTPSIISRLSPAPPFLPPMIFFTSPFLNKPPIEVAGDPTWFGHSLINSIKGPNVCNKLIHGENLMYWWNWNDQKHMSTFVGKYVSQIYPFCVKFWGLSVLKFFTIFYHYSAEHLRYFSKLFQEKKKNV